MKLAIFATEKNHTYYMVFGNEFTKAQMAAYVTGGNNNRVIYAGRDTESAMDMIYETGAEKFTSFTGHVPV